MTGLMFEDGDGRRWTVKTVDGGSHVKFETTEDAADDNPVVADIYIPFADLGRLADAIAWIRKHAAVPMPSSPI